MTKVKKTAAPKAIKAPSQEPDAEMAVDAKPAQVLPGDDATADELAHFIRHNPVFMTLGHEERNALTQRLIEAKREA
jgi:hypothetical protein